MSAPLAVPASTSERALFEIPRDIVYLNCANMSPQLRAVGEAGNRAVARKASPWTLASAEWFAPSECLRGLVGRLLGAGPDDIALVPSVSYGMAVAAANVTVRPGQSILLVEQEFPSSVYAWRACAERHGAFIRTVRRPIGSTWTDGILAAIDDRTGVVAAPHCHWMDGTLIDLERVGATTRAVGAALVVDASQSLGALPLDVRLVRPDFLMSVGYKWLLGPYALGYLYVAPHHSAEGVPLEHSWLARAGSDDFARLTEYTDVLRPGARRFDMGEFPQFVLTPMAIAALEQILEWGVESIQRRLATLTRHLEEGLRGVAGWCLPDTDRAGHMTAISRAGGFSNRLADRLKEAKVYASLRGDRLRISPHVYNDASDIETLIDVVRTHEAP